MTDHQHQYDGGYCLECGEASRCELCDEAPWESRCDICQKGRICSACYYRCEHCDQKVCRVCDECDCQ